MADPRRVLNEVLDSPSREGSQALPPLTVEKSSLEQWWDELIQSISDFMDSWFPADRTFGSSTSESLLLFVWYLAISIVVLVLLYYLIRWMRKDRTTAATAATIQRTHSISVVEHLLAVAVDAGDWARAMRLRCLLFILQQDLPMSWSPGSDPDVGIERCMPCYRAMYGSDAASADLYQQLEKLLPTRRQR